MTTPGTPEKLNPETWKGHCGDTVRHWRLTWVQMPGIPRERCGSLASSGLPVVVRSPETTQEFEPMASPCPSRVGIASRAAEADSKAACPSLRNAGGTAVAACCAVAEPAPSPPWRGWAGCGRTDRAGRAGRSASRRSPTPREPGPGELVVVVPPQVPGHRLEPREGVDRRPRLDAVSGQLQARTSYSSDDRQRALRPA